MKKREWSEALNHIDNDIVINFIKQRDVFQKKNKTRKIWIRTLAIAACFAIIITAIFTAPMLLEQGSNEEDQIPVWDTPQLSMVDIFGKSSMYFDNNSGGAENEFGCGLYGQHSGEAVPDAKYLYIKEIKNNEYFPIYGYQDLKGKELDEQEFNAFSSPLLEKAEACFNLDSSEYQKNNYEDSLSIVGASDGLNIRAVQSRFSNFFRIEKNKRNDSVIEINGQSMEIDENLSDEEIIASLNSAKKMFFEFFGVSFTNATVERSFQNYGRLTTIIVYFHNENDEYEPYAKNSFNEDLIFLFNFRYEYNKQDYFISSVYVGYSETRQRFDERYQTVAEAKAITLEKAVDFLRKGCFLPTSHGKCYICWENLNFAQYDFVEIQYSSFKVNGMDIYMSIPYYVFYKRVPAEYIYGGLYVEDCEIYETVRVPAIEIIGYEEYFAVPKKYKLEISKPSNVTVRNKVKDSYSAGEPVFISLDIINGYYNVYLNDARLDFDNYSEEHLFYNFVMPEKDVVIRIEPKYNVPFSPSKKEKSTE